MQEGAAQECLRRVDDIGVREGPQVGAATFAHLALVEEMDRGSGPLGRLDEGDTPTATAPREASRAEAGRTDRLAALPGGTGATCGMVGTGAGAGSPGSVVVM
ncbi:hypothetical protein [Streptomyces sp. Ncost-T10-10d]|uniref:hypothetical protein n=1 Tax=Streptomyces sp. Ncost-T10-10d TaxID=1839774 RepID=UPI00159EF80B